LNQLKILGPAQFLDQLNSWTSSILGPAQF
jgi:hypothetical protein